jgi:hypothetical protein
MKMLTDTWRALVKRKLWPVAVLLLAALVAVPLTLAKTPEVQAPPANAVAEQEEGAPVTYVTSADEAATEDDGTAERRRTLGAEKDPFEPAPLPKAKKAKKKASAKKTSTESAESTATDAGTSTGSGAGSGSSDATTPVEPVATATPVPTATPTPAYSVKVRFGNVEGASPKAEDVERLEVLPSAKRPVLVFRGLASGGKVAIFELSGTVVAEGDGKCEPTPENCQNLKLRAGETEFITVTGTGEDTSVQYQLELVKINASTKASAAKLEKKREQGTAVLSELDRTLGYAFNPAKGTLEKLSKKAAERLSSAAREAAL